jgi:ADP-ribose pyrophosphatase YjhB (NUDIX family)
VLFLNSFKKINMFLRTYHNSFGIIPLYKKDGKIFICCIQNKKSGEWGLPKGTPENNETQFETAKRELQEETGISEFKIFGGKTFFEEYTFDKGDVSHFKRNTYYLAFVDEMKEKDDIIDARDMKWISLDDIETFFKFESVKKVVREVKNYLDVFPLITEYKGKSGENYLFEYYESDSLEHIPLKSMSQVQVCAFHGDKLLIVNNQNKFNTYSLVGGSIEEGETSEHCLERELKEESNMRLIDFKLIGYQRCTNLSDPSKAPEYQIRYFAQVEPIGPFTPDCDPDGDVTELLEIDPVDYKKYFDWGKTSEVIIERAIRFKDSL